MIKYVCDMCGSEHPKDQNLVTVTFSRLFMIPREYHLCSECYKKLQNEILNCNKEEVNVI